MTGSGGRADSEETNFCSHALGEQELSLESPSGILEKPLGAPLSPPWEKDGVLAPAWGAARLCWGLLGAPKTASA